MKPVDIAEILMFTTVRLVADNGNCGTGYYYNVNCSKGSVPVIITNKHVVNYNPNEVMTFHIHLTSDGESDEGYYEVKYASQWVFHSKYDLCFTYVGGLFNTIEKLTGKSVFYTCLNKSLIYTDEQLRDLSMMESVVMIGYPNGLWDQNHNYPIFRYGYTASHPGYGFNEDDIGIVDIACFPGSSGSPILVLNEGGYREKEGGIIIGANRVVFLGTLFAGPVYSVDGQIVVKNIPTVQVPISQSPIMMNLGYYIKAAALREFDEVIEEAYMINRKIATGDSCLQGT